MRLNVSAWAIRNPIAPLVLFLVLVVLGLVSFRGLAVTRMPNVDVPIVSVSITQSGAAPSELQTQVTKWVEDSIAGVRGVKHITSSITEGSSVTTVEFRLEVNTDRAVNDVKDAVSKIRINLPPHHRRAHHSARRDHRSADTHLRREIAGDEAGRPVVVRRG